MLLIFPPVAKACEPPAGIARLAGALLGNDIPCTLLDANIEGLLFLLATAIEPGDTWGRRACRNLQANLASLRNPEIYLNMDRYRRAVADVNRVLELIGRENNILLSLANFQDPDLSPLNSDDLIQAAGYPERNIYFPYFSNRIRGILAGKQPDSIGFSLNYLSQAIPAFAMIGYVKQIAPTLKVVVGGGLVTSWMSNPLWNNPFSELIDHILPGPGEQSLVQLLGRENRLDHFTPVFEALPLADYLSPGLVLPYAASTGCYWNNCSFCPEKAEKNPYTSASTDRVLDDIRLLRQQTSPVMFHFLDNAISPSMLKALSSKSPGVDWYGFTRVHPGLTDVDFCRALRKSGCVMLKLGLESGSQAVLDSMGKGIDLVLVAEALNALRRAGIMTFVYLLFGTPSETLKEARQTLDLVRDHADAITYLNLAIFNMPVSSPEAGSHDVSGFSEGDLSLYTDFVHPHGWDRKAVRRFLDQEFKRDPVVAEILQRNPPHFTSNHAPFFTGDH